LVGAFETAARLARLRHAHFRPDHAKEVFSRAVDRRPGTADDRVRFAITAFAVLIGLVPPDAGSIWAALRIGEINTIRPLAIGDIDAHREDCKGVGQFAQPKPDHHRTYRSIETLLKMEDPDAHEAALVGLYGDETLDRDRPDRPEPTLLQPAIHRPEPRRLRYAPVFAEAIRKSAPYWGRRQKMIEDCNLDTLSEPMECTDKGSERPQEQSVIDS
jgi:hypothetical protein